MKEGATPPSGEEGEPNKAESKADLSEIEPKVIDYFKNEYINVRERNKVGEGGSNVDEEEFVISATSGAGAHHHKYFPGFSFGFDPSDKRPEDVAWLDKICRRAIDEANRELETAKGGETASNATVEINREQQEAAGSGKATDNPASVTTAKPADSGKRVGFIRRFFGGRR